MVNGSQAVSSVGGGAPLYVRASSATAALSAESTGTAEAATNLPADQVVSETSQALRYNSFEFSYRQDFGKIVLVRQKPDTGELVQQFPSEYYLRKYADSQRVAKSAEGAGAARSTTNTTAAAAAATPAPDAGASAAQAAPTPAPAVESAPAVSSAPALPSAAAGTGSARVNVTV